MRLKTWSKLTSPEPRYEDIVERDMMVADAGRRQAGDARLLSGEERGVAPR